MKVLDEAYISRPLLENDHFRSLSEAMKSDAAKSTRIQIVSGYFGIDYVLEILKQVPSKARSSCVVTLIFGYDSTTELFYGDIRKSHLEERVKDLGFRKKNSTIILFKDSAPLHTKLYGFLISTNPVWYIGSANLSKAIEGDRHELMLRITGKSHALEDYIQALIAVKSQNENPELIGVKRFFSAGSILFRPSRHRRFTYDGFIIKPDDRKKISKQLGRDSAVPHSDPSAEGFGFDLLSAINISNRSKVIEQRVMIKPYCIETVYGYWVPSAYTSKIESQIFKGRKSEENKLYSIREALSNISDDQISFEFQAYLNGSKEFFDKINIYVESRKNIVGSFQDFLKVRREWLNDDEWIKKNSSKFFLTEMPDIWSDARATEIFISSFCEDVCSVLNSPGNKPRIYQRISNRLKLTDNPTANEIKIKLSKAQGNFWW